MAKLTPNAVCTVNGVTVYEKIIPDGTRWKDAAKAAKAGFSAGSLYKKQAKLSGGTGKPGFVTIHNTNDLDEVYDDGEQYTRATYNENMGSSRVHFYTDDTGAWQNLKAGTGLFASDPIGAAEVSWHSGDGSAATGGNMTSLSIEIIMGETAEHDRIAKDNGARLAAWLLWRHGLSIDALVTHTYWVNKSAGKTFADRDVQCCNPIKGKKWCPSYIFASSNSAVALKNWKAFKQLVKSYLDALCGSSGSGSTDTRPQPEKPTTETQGATGSAFKIGDLVDFKGYKHYSSANASKGSSVKPCRAKVTQVYKKGKHPYHVRAVNSLGAFTSGVYGWVDAADLVPVGKIEAGCKVKVLKAVTYTGKPFKTWHDVYDVLSVNGARAVIGIGKTVTAAVNVNNIERV